MWLFSSILIPGELFSKVYVLTGSSVSNYNSASVSSGNGKSLALHMLLLFLKIESQMMLFFFYWPRLIFSESESYFANQYLRIKG